MNFSEQVKKVKNEKGITNERLSSRSGIPFSTLNKILSNDAANPKLDVVIAIATALDCPISYLIDGEGEFINQSLSEEEKHLIKDFRQLDTHGKELVSLVLAKEAERVVGRADAESKSERAEKTVPAGARILQFSPSAETVATGSSLRKIPLFDLPVSAGPGVFLDGDSAETLEIKLTKTTSQADFALRISGDSMEPTFSDGEIILVKSQQQVEKGELGIFIGDGQGYFKRFMGDCLHSLNPSHEDIPLSSFSSLSCCGKVIGQLPHSPHSN